MGTSILQWRHRDRKERRASARRGSGNSVATVLVDKQPARRLCAIIAVLPLQVRFSKPRLACASRSWLHARRSLQKSGCDLQRSFVSHGGLTPPALTLQCECLSAKNDFCDARTQFHKSGRREPAVGVREAHLQERFRKVAGDCRRCAHERRWSRTSEPTGGLRPPLLCCGANVCRRKNDFSDARTHIQPRAAGVSPPWM